MLIRMMQRERWFDPGSAGATRRAHLIAGILLFAFVLALPAGAARKPGNPGHQSLRRADFLVLGACPLCCKHILWKLRHCPGVLAAEISIRSPHFAAVIYDKRKTLLQKVIAQITEEKTQVMTVEEHAVSSVPARLELKAGAPPSGIHYPDEQAPAAVSKQR